MTKGEGRLVLLVDDSPDNRAMYAEYLALQGFDVLEAVDGVDAVAAAKEHLPDVIVMDVVLPRLDGCAATRVLRADPVTRRIRIVALSGHGEGEVRDRALEAGVDLFVQKPCLPNALVEQLRALLAR